jgi:hypothetical protein
MKSEAHAHALPLESQQSLPNTSQLPQQYSHDKVTLSTVSMVSYGLILMMCHLPDNERTLSNQTYPSVSFKTRFSEPYYFLKEKQIEILTLELNQARAHAAQKIYQHKALAEELQACQADNKILENDLQLAKQRLEDAKVAYCLCR